MFLKLKQDSGYPYCVQGEEKADTLRTRVAQKELL